MIINSSKITVPAVHRIRVKGIQQDYKYEKTVWDITKSLDENNRIMGILISEREVIGIVKCEIIEGKEERKRGIYSIPKYEIIYFHSGY